MAFASKALVRAAGEMEIATTMAIAMIAAADDGWAHVTLAAGGRPLTHGHLSVEDLQRGARDFCLIKVSQ